LTILLDSNAGAPLHPAVREALFAFLGTQESASEESTGNPSSLHAYGRKSSAIIAAAEAAILKTVQAPPSEWSVTFTSSGTEANQLGIRSVLEPAIATGKGAVWAVSEIEHSCVLDLIPEMKGRGVEIRMLKANASGEVNELGVAEGANLLSVIGVGNETGILHDLLTSHILSAKNDSTTRKTVVHRDFVAGWGKKELNLSAPFSPDLIAISGHKLGGLSGVGALIHRKSNLIKRKGTPNLAGITGMKALAEDWPNVVSGIAQLATIRDAFEIELLKRFLKVVLTGEGLGRAPNVSHFYFPGLKKDLSLVPLLDLRGFAVSSGSACASGAPQPSHVLLAMGLSELDARNALRVSLHPRNSGEELTAFLDALGEILKRNEVI
jgi:cysteine desulfurase